MPDVSHVEIDVVNEPELISALGVTQTPTTLLVRPTGDIVTWIRGAATEQAVRQAIEDAKKRLEEESNDWSI
jgi:thioredoxin-like negative regulator of GroEL